MPRENVVPIAILVLSVAAFLTLGAGDIASTSPTFDETTHLASGWSSLVTRDFHLNPEHPPLLKQLAAAPLLAMKVWPAGLRSDGSRAFSSLNEMWTGDPANTNVQWFFAHRWLYALRDSAPERPTTEITPRSDFLNDSESMFRRARATLMLITGLGILIIAGLWSYELWGLWGAALSVALLAIEPTLLGHSTLVTTDAGIAFFMFGSVYFFWRCKRRASIGNVAGFALFFALAFVSKFSAVLLLPMLILLAFARGARKRLFATLGIGIVTAFVVIWAVYGFKFAATTRPLPMREIVAEWYARASLVSSSMTQAPSNEDVARIRGYVRIGVPGRLLLFAHEHHLLPEAYLYGFAHVRSGALYRDSFLDGKFSPVGFPSYFIRTFFYKTPIAAIVAILAAIVFAVKRKGTSWLLVPVATYLAISIGTSLNIGHRHILPLYPFLYVLCGALPRRWLIAAAFSAVSVIGWGHHLSYFNELAGGPKNGYTHLVDSNVDWGQDLPALRAWIDAHPQTAPVNLIYFGSADPRFYGIRFLNLEQGYYVLPEVPLAAAKIPGVLAISVTDYQGVNLPATQRHFWKQWLDERHARTIGMAGYSMLLIELSDRAVEH